MHNWSFVFVHKEEEFQMQQQQQQKSGEVTDLLAKLPLSFHLICTKFKC